MSEDNLHDQSSQEDEAASAANLNNRNCDQDLNQILDLLQDSQPMSDPVVGQDKTDHLENRMNELYSFEPATKPAQTMGWFEKQIEETQVGIANIVAVKNKGQFLFIKSHGFLAWTGLCWEANRKLILRAIESVLFDRIAEGREQLDKANLLEKEAKAKGSEGSVQANEIRQEANLKIKIAKRMLTAKGLKDIEALCQSRLEFEAEASQFDRNPWLLNCSNGTLNLKTGLLQPHRPEDYITRVIPTAYDPDAQCPMWEKFMSEIMVEQMAMVLYLQRVLGLCLSGDSSNACFFVLYGIGRNGKSTMIETYQELLGERYAQEVPSELLLAHRANPQGPSEGYARLAGIRMATANETDEGQRLAVSKVKQLTGNDKITARFLHQHSFEFKPEFKLLLRTNHLPEIPPHDKAIWARVRPIPFLANFTDHPDRELPEKLKTEFPGILAWAVRGFHDYLVLGLNEPQIVKDEVNRYRSKMDEFNEFIESEILHRFEQADDQSADAAEQPLKDAQEWMWLKEIHAAYLTWAQEMSVPALSSKAIASKLRMLGWRDKRVQDGVCFYPPRINNRG